MPSYEKVSASAEEGEEEHEDAAPKLAAEDDEDDHDDDHDHNDHQNDHEPLNTWSEEARGHVAIALPVSVNMLAYRAPWITSIMFVGRLGETPLAAASMASTLGNVTGLSLLVGLSSGLATLGAQAFGAGAYDTVGVVFQRCLLVFAATCALVSAFWCAGVEPFLVATGQDPAVAAMAQSYMRLLVPGLWGSGVNFALQKFLQVQGLTRPPALAAVTTAVLHVPLNFLFIYGFGLGWRGAAVATSLNQLLTPLLLLAIICRGRCGAAICSGTSSRSTAATASTTTTTMSPTVGGATQSATTGAAGAAGATLAGRASEWLDGLLAPGVADPAGTYMRCWSGWRREALAAAPMLDFCRLAAGGLVMIMEWWASEIAILLAGVADGAVGLSTMAIYQTTLSTIFMFSVGYQVSAATRVGQFLGRGRPLAARRAAATAPALAFCVTAPLAVLLFLLRRPLPFAFVGRGQPDLAARVSRTYGFLCLYVVGDGVSTAFGGAILGAGKQGVAGGVVVLAYFAVALPIAYLLALRQGYGFMGCVAAMTLGTFLQCAGNGLICAFVRWDNEARAANAKALQSQVASPRAASLPPSSSSYAEVGQLGDEEIGDPWAVGDDDWSEHEDGGDMIEGGPFEVQEESL